MKKPECIINFKIIMAEENISQKFRFKNIGETRNHFIHEINRNELMSKKHKNVFGSLGILYLYRHCKLCSGNKVRILICKIYLKSQHSVILR